MLIKDFLLVGDLARQREVRREGDEAKKIEKVNLNRIILRLEIEDHAKNPRRNPEGTTEKIFKIS